jgi:hypothetical protein
LYVIHLTLTFIGTGEVREAHDILNHFIVRLTLASLPLLAVPDP